MRNKILKLSGIPKMCALLTCSATDVRVDIAPNRNPSVLTANKVFWGGSNKHETIELYLLSHRNSVRIIGFAGQERGNYVINFS